MTIRSKLAGQICRVVVIDDSSEDRAEVRRLLLRGSERRYAFIEADSGATGIKAVLNASSPPPDCVFLDYNLPDMTAAEVILALAGPSGLSVSPVVVFTGVTGTETGRAVLRAGAQDYIGKDWSTPDSLTRALENATERWGMVCKLVQDLRHREESLRTSEDMLRIALRAARATAFVRDVRPEPLGRTAADALLDSNAYESTAEVRTRVHPEDRAAFDLAGNACVDNGPEYHCLYRMMRPDGSQIWLEEWGTLDRAANGSPRWLTGFAMDITERKQSERALLRSVCEKEVMLREIHHRVKNNLAVICSLLYLQAGTTRDEKTAQVLQEARDRVRSMSLVHEHLYNSADLGAVAFGEYAKTLATEIISTYQTDLKDIDLVATYESFHLSIEQAIPCGLIINELLTNCLRHAFSDRDTGEVHIALTAAEGACSLQLSDNGVGLPPGLETRIGNSLGVRLVRLLASQLDGTLDYSSSDSGTEVRLTFPILESKKSYSQEDSNQE